MLVESVEIWLLLPVTSDPCICSVVHPGLKTLTRSFGYATTAVVLHDQILVWQTGFSFVRCLAFELIVCVRIL